MFVIQTRYIYHTCSTDETFFPYCLEFCVYFSISRKFWRNVFLLLVVISRFLMGILPQVLSISKGLNKLFLKKVLIVVYWVSIPHLIIHYFQLCIHVSYGVQVIKKYNWYDCFKWEFEQRFFLNHKNANYLFKLQHFQIIFIKIVYHYKQFF